MFFLNLGGGQKLRILAPYQKSIKNHWFYNVKLVFYWNPYVNRSQRYDLDKDFNEKPTFAYKTNGFLYFFDQVLKSLTLAPT